MDGECGLNFCDDWSDGEEWAVTSTRAKRVGNATPRREILEDADAWYELILPSAAVPASRGRRDGDEDDPSPSTSSLLYDLLLLRLL